MYPGAQENLLIYFCIKFLPGKNHHSGKPGLLQQKADWVYFEFSLVFFIFRQYPFQIKKYGQKYILPFKKY
jgi:hypothetical protein